MKTTEEILKIPIEIENLLRELDFTQENLAQAALSQGRLFAQAARYYVQRMRARMAAETVYDEGKASVGQFHRKQEFDKRLKLGSKGKEMTESQLKELVYLDKSIKELKSRQDRAESHEEFAKQLLEAFRWRGTAVKILAGVLVDEARSEVRVKGHEQAKEDLMDKYHRAYPKGEA